MDNISIVMIAFKKLQDYLEKCRVQTPPPIFNKSEQHHLIGGVKSIGAAGNLNGDSNLYGANGKLSEKTDIASQKSQT